MKKKMLVAIAALIGISSLVVLGSSPQFFTNLLENVQLDPVTKLFSSEKKTKISDNKQKQTPLNDKSKEKESAEKNPVQVTYLFLFKQLEASEEKARESESKGQDSSEYRNLYKRLANLTDEQSLFLMKTAIDCSAEVKVKDEVAKQIADQIRAAYQAELSSAAEPVPPKPSVELTKLQEQRDEIILKYIEILKAGFGDDFPRFESFITSHITSNITIDMKNNAKFPPSDQKRLNEDTLSQSDQISDFQTRNKKEVRK